MTSATLPRMAYTVAEAAQVAGCSEKTIRRALWADELKGHQRKAPNGSWRIRPADLERWALGGVK